MAGKKFSATANCEITNLDEIKAKSQELIERSNGLYKKEFCDQLVKHMESGLDFESFAKVLGVSKNTLNRWVQDRPGFAYAKEVGEGAYYHHWVELGMRGAKGLVKGYNASTWIFTMKNKFGWKDIIENNNKYEGDTTYHVEVNNNGKFASARPKIV